ncbi:succinyldiaminopimelate transaminase [Actinomycetaceae bacterium WB03_NA08]|uniref:Succinyldiaminopimelate transaminase n=1 Tax=Scrofimicrobium canadense TaxID=2652290 RepID=A0A6N7VP22_9ACTO|nr:succinyldiaminopimelate transaminase [Scrofimicrobium canadense]MSS83447.1 succinyldiaminopimelate transaminase [Scrofimicrobium canadense]
MSGLPRPLGLPDFPWDTLAAARKQANGYREGIVDLSVGTPVDPTPATVQKALREAADAPGYPPVVGTGQVKQSIHQWMRHRGMIELSDDAVIPTTGSKEMVAWLPKLIGVRPGDKVLYPEVAYPTYHVSAVLAGAEPVPVNPYDLSTWPDDAAFVWLNSPSNPTGEVMSAEWTQICVQWARERGTVIVADECYAELPWSPRYQKSGVPSLLWPAVCDDDARGLAVLYSLSKQSNMAGYRGAVMVGDQNLVSAVVEGRKHSGLMTPAPVQAAIAVGLNDWTHIHDQSARYGRRRAALLRAVETTGLIPYERTEAGLYLWLSASEDFDFEETDLVAPNRGRALVQWFARRGILVAPGDFYGEKSVDFVRVALTATDESIEKACIRLSA